MKESPMKALLIFPNVDDNIDVFSTSSLIGNITKKILKLGQSNMVPPHSLLMLAAVTPPDVEIRLIDERLEPIDFNETADIVGITVVTKTALRTYRIADQFLKRDIPVVLGGIHASVLPREAKQHASSVVIGEGEKIWPQLLSDVKQKRLKPFYHGGHQNDPALLPWPRRDILKHPEWYLSTKTVMATRGCENHCTFCSCGGAVGKRYRTRNVEDVIEEIKSIPGKHAMFIDDNLGWNIPFTQNLLQALIPLHIHWLGLFSVSTLEDNELLDLLAKSGCLAIILGFESISPEVIDSIKKQQTNCVERYRQVIKQIHSRGMLIYGNFILGFDRDRKTVFQELIDFIQETAIECPMINILVPYPGSVLYRQFDKQGRLFHKNWNFYDVTSPNVVYHPQFLSPEELIEGYLKVITTVNTAGSYLKRVLPTNRKLKSTMSGLHINNQKLKTVLAGMDKTRKSLDLVRTGLNNSR
jgi:radical SAM superfamily enzyme YgiQ (UPF0313 family)